jgi:hypothetical protein
MSCQMVFHMPCLWQNSAMFSELEGLGQKTRVRWHDSRKTRTRPAELMHAVQQLGFTSPRAAGSRVQPVSGSSIIVIRGMAASHASHSHRRRHTHTQRSQSRQHPLAGPQVLFLLMWQSGIHSPGRCRCNGGLIGTGRRELH